MVKGIINICWWPNFKVWVEPEGLVNNKWSTLQLAKEWAWKGTFKYEVSALEGGRVRQNTVFFCWRCSEVQN